MRPVASSRFLIFVAAFAALAMESACGSDDDTEADRRGVGAECTKPENCAKDQQCLAFKGGYCGIANCTGDKDCPQASACILHTDGKNYCFRTCAEKTECNTNRTVENEANCSANITFVDAANSRKACVPPSGM